jgi:hypothetical protein
MQDGKINFISDFFKDNDKLLAEVTTNHVPAK